MVLEHANLNAIRNRNDLPLITQHLLQTVQVVWPPSVVEQQAIAAALSDVDELIGALDKLIAKKRALKLAAMQQLLTGKTRLPGFLHSSEFKSTHAGATPGDWDIRVLGQVVEFLDGRRRPVKSVDRAKMTGRYPYYGASGIVDYVNDFLFDEELILLGEDGENILSRNSRLAFRVSGKIWVNNHAHVLKPTSEIEIGYLVEYLENLEYGEYNSGTAQPKLNKKTCSRIPIRLPPLDEQQAIASILSDMDEEIIALEKRRDKTKAIKQGMMQSLLTGRVRLVD